MQDDWFCPDCMAGRPAVSRFGVQTTRQKFLAGNRGIGLVKIESLWRCSTEIFFRGRWYATPEETATGRQVCQSAHILL